MADLATSAAAASLIVGLMSIPAASSTIDSSAAVSDQIPDISERNASPVEVSKEVSSSGFEASIRTAFDSFSLETSPSSTEAELEEPSSRLEVERKPSGVTWTLTTTSGVLEIEQTGQSVTETVETPEGSLEIIQRNGATSRSFKGEEREEVISAYHDLRSVMEQKKREMDRKRQRIEDSSKPEIEVIANESTADGFGDNTEEHVVIENNGLSKVQLQGWTLEDDSGSFELPDYALPAGEKVEVYSGDEETLEKGEAIYDSGLGWNDNGDVATLSNGKGQKIAEKSY